MEKVRDLMPGRHSSVTERQRERERERDRETECEVVQSGLW